MRGRTLRRRTLRACLALLLTACGGGGDPVAPGGGGGGGATPTVASVVVTPADLALVPGQSATLSATATSAAGAPVAVAFTWSTGNAAVASVSSAGLVTAVGSGSTQIEARAGTVVGRSTIVVADTLPTSLVVTPSDSVTLSVGQLQPLAATARSAGGAVVGAPITWESEASTIASVSASGVLTAVAPGVTVIRARTGVLSATLSVRITPPPPSAPTNLSAASRRGEVELIWTDNSGGQAGFEIERRVAPDTTFVSRGMTTLGTAQFVDVLDVASDTLIYRVRAVVSGAASGFAVATVLAPLPPLEATVTDIVDLMNTRLPSPAVPVDGRDLGAELAALVPQLIAHPDVITVLLSQETASAQVVLRDGQSINLVHNKVPTAAEIAEGAAMRLARAASPTSGWGVRARVADLAAPAIPASRQAGLVSIGGGAEVMPELAAILSAGGYSPRTLNGTIEGMRGYQGLGALYLDTHGTVWLPVDRVDVHPTTGERTVQFGKAKYALQTDTEISASRVRQYRVELDRGDLTINVAPIRLGTADIGVDLPVHRATFSITESFITRYWSLDDAIVVLHSCFGGSGPFVNATCVGSCATAQANYYDPTVIRNALLSVGANVVQSYDNYVWPTTSLPSMAYFLDRLVGANKRTPIATPERRPFDLALVRAAMGQRGLLSHVRPGRPSPNTTFDSFLLDEDIIGAPSIREIDVIDDAAGASGRAELHGTFGADQGTVRIGGTNVAVTSWARKLITVEGPFTGIGAAGAVVVESPSGLKSNEVPMTEWRGGITLTVEFDNGTAKAVGEVDVKFRADVHERRLTVEQNPRPRTVTTYISPATFGRVIGSGAFDAGGGQNLELTGNRTMQTLSKATVDAGGEFTTERSSFGGLATIDVQARTLEFCFSINGMVTARGGGGGGSSDEFELPVLFVLPGLADYQRQFMHCLRLPMNANFSTSSGRRTAAQEGVRMTFEWEAFQATEPPRPETKG